MSAWSGELINIVTFIGRDWEYWQRRPHTQALSLQSRVLCVEPPLTFASLRNWPREFLRQVRRVGRLTAMSDSLWLCKPMGVLPYSVSMRVPLVGLVNRVVIGLQLRRTLAKLGMKRHIVVIEHPAQEFVVGMLDEDVLCYEVHDAYRETLGPSDGMKRASAVAEDRVARRADIVLTTSRNLAEAKAKLNGNTHFIPNAADVVLFGRSIRAGTEVPLDLQAIPSPRVGLIGHISESHTDIELLTYLAERHPDWSVVVIGRLDVGRAFKSSGAFKRWLACPNVYHVGFRPYGLLPCYLKGIDVCLLPYLVNQYTANVFPNKVFQYLAGGKPVVSVDLPELRPYEGTVAIAKDRADFERLVEEALRHDGPEDVCRRVRLAQENSVENRAALEISLLKQSLVSKGRPGGQAAS